METLALSYPIIIGSLYLSSALLLQLFISSHRMSYNVAALSCLAVASGVQRLTCGALRPHWVLGSTVAIVLLEVYLSASFQNPDRASSIIWLSRDQLSFHYVDVE